MVENDGGENSGSRIEFGDGLEELFSVLLKDAYGDHRAEATPLPGQDRGTGNGETVAQRPGTGSHHVLPQAMVVGPACVRARSGDGNHRERITHPRPAGRKPE